MGQKSRATSGNVVSSRVLEKRKKDKAGAESPYLYKRCLDKL